MNYAEYMRTLYDYTNQNWKHSVCRECGGTGVIPVHCCSGLSLNCGCNGLPIDFKESCDKCGRFMPDGVLSKEGCLGVDEKEEVRNG